MPMTTWPDPAMPTSTPATHTAKSHGARARLRRAASVRLPEDRSPVDVAQVVRFEQRTGHEARRDAEPPRTTRDREVLHVGGTDGRHDAEVDEHEELTKAVVAVGTGTTGVEPASGDRRRANCDEPPRRARGEQESRQTGQEERGEGGVANPLGRDELRRRQAKRTDAHLVGPANTVGVVIGVVRADLQRQRDDVDRVPSCPS